MNTFPPRGEGSATRT